MIFFDLDDTLYDRGAPFREAYNELYPEFQTAGETVYRCCTKRGDEVFEASQRGDISMDEMYIYRYCKGFADAGEQITPEMALQFQSVYREKQKMIRLSSCIENMLDTISKQVPIGLITNGPSEKQRGKIEALGLMRFFKENTILISGEVHIDKPDLKIFHMAEDISGKEPKELIYVGDSLSHDIIPAAACGWDTIWMNGRKKEGTMPSERCVMITAEQQLLPLLQNKI